MKLEDQVCSLELAKRLKELGLKQDGVWYWHYMQGMAYIPISYDERHWRLRPKKTRGYRTFAAFTVAELGEMLPQVELENEWYIPVSYRFTNDPPSYECELLHREMLKPSLHKTVEANEADARAKMLIYLIENKLLTI